MTWAAALWIALGVYLFFGLIFSIIGFGKRARSLESAVLVIMVIFFWAALIPLYKRQLRIAQQKQKDKTLSA